LRNYNSDDDEAQGTAIKLHRLKTNAHSISERQVIEALKIIKNRQGPILIHCLHGSDRTGAVLAMYRMVFQNYTKDEAIKEMKEGGFGFHRIYGNIVRMIEQANIEQIRKEVSGTE
jgi:protein tyrosine/serine phosphatase